MTHKITYDYLKENGFILFETVVGSQAYGTQTPESDEDRKFVYILPQDYILGTGYVEQLNVTKDITGWEIRRFLELLGTDNPTVLELLNSPEDCIIYKHPLFDVILEHKEEFITKGCKNSFGGYARQQIKKAKGLDKKQNWEKDMDRVTRKEILDFCYVIDGCKSIPIKTWFNDNGYNSDAQKFCGVVNVPNARDMYALYFDIKASNCFSDDEDLEDREHNKKVYKDINETVGLGYKGIVKVGGSTNAGESNQLRLSSIPKGETAIAIFTYNKDGYTRHCKDYKEYQEWLENRNTQRYVDTKAHGQQIDGKNMMHCMRLIRMAQEIGSGEGIIVRRLDAKELLGIRRGEVDLEALMVMADEAIVRMDEIFDESNLPDKVNPELVNKLLLKIRREFYQFETKQPSLETN
jgi:predicted nucleotidyltransferase